MLSASHKILSTVKADTKNTLSSAQYQMLEKLCANQRY
jgi:hypothetical protein